MPKTGRPFAAFDIDGTLVRWQLYHAIADELVKQGFIDSGAYRAVKNARMNWKRRSGPESFKVYERQLIKAYERMLLELTVKDFNYAVQSVFSQYREQVYTYTRQLIADLKKDGYLLFAISGSQIEIVELIARHYGFDDSVGTYYHHDKQKFTGAATMHLGGKDKALKDLINKHKATMKGSVAVGDSFNDIKMLELVERPIAFNPERQLLEHATKSGWQVIIERKNVIYELEPKDGRYILA